MNKKYAIIFFILLLIPGLTLGTLQITGTIDLLEDYYDYNDNILVVDDKSSTTQRFPQMCLDDEGGIIITWSDNRSGSSDIYAQKINKYGEKMWSEQGVVVCSAPDVQIHPEIISDGEGGAIILWQNGTNSFYLRELYAQKINSAGELVWDSTGMSNSVIIWENCTYFEAFEIVSDGNGGGLVCLQTFLSSNESLIVLRILSNGQLDAGWGTNGTAIITHGCSYYDPVFTSDGTGGAFLAWQDVRNSSENDIYAQRISNTGDIEWIENGIPISTTYRFQQLPQIITDGEGGAILAWSDGRGIDTGTSYDIYALRVDQNGNIVSGWDINGTLISNSSAFEGQVQITSDGAHGVIAVWNSYNVPLTDNDIYAQRLDYQGNKMWGSEELIICNALVDQSLYPICSNSSGYALIPWIDDRNENTTGQDIYGQLISPEGEILWEENGRAINTEAGSQSFTKRVNTPKPNVIANEKGNFIIAWESAQNYNVSRYDVYVQNISHGFEGIFHLNEFISSTAGIISMIYLLLLIISLVFVVKPSKQ